MPKAKSRSSSAPRARRTRNPSRSASSRAAASSAVLPIPAGASYLGSGLGGQSQIALAGEERSLCPCIAFEEHAFDGVRAYYPYVRKGSWVYEYTIRLNQSGRFELPATRVEALYAPEAFGELPNAPFEVKP